MKEELNKAVEVKTEKELEDLLAGWSKSLPEEFTLGTVGNGNGTKRPHYPDLHFKADDEIPGLYYADLDLRALGQNGNSGIVFDESKQPPKKL
jgi:hypothetical protein